MMMMMAVEGIIRRSISLTWQFFHFNYATSDFLFSPPNTEMKVSATEFQQGSGKAGSASSGQMADDDRAIMNDFTNVIHRFEVVNIGNGSMPQVVIDVRLPVENGSLIVVNGVSVSIRC